MLEPISTGGRGISPATSAGASPWAARNAAVFLFDEPLSNLDAKLRVAMRAEIRNCNRRLRLTTTADRNVVMNDGWCYIFAEIRQTRRLLASKSLARATSAWRFQCVGLSFQF